MDIGAIRTRGLDQLVYILPIEKDITNLVAETLLELNEEIKLEPTLATSWRLSDDGLRWTLELRKGVKFHDGTPFNAQTLRATYDRWINEGANPVAFRNIGRLVDGYEVLNEYSVRIKTKTVFPGFGGLLGGEYGTEVISPEAIKKFGKDLPINQVGTGPFKMEAIVPNESVTLVRNDEYWDGSPLLDKVVFRTIPDASARTAALVTGQTQLSIDVSPSQIAQLKTQAEIQLVEQPLVNEIWWSLNAKRPPFNRVEARQAINYAIDMDEITRVAYEGLLRPFQGPITPLIFKPDPSIKGFTHDPDRARQLWQQAGAVGTRPEFIYSDNPVTTRLAELLQAQVRRVGIELQLVRTDRAGAGRLAQEGKFDLLENGNGMSAGDPWRPLVLELLSTAANNQRYGHFDPRFDTLINRLGSEADPTKRGAILNEFYKVYFEYAPWVATANRVRADAFSKRVQGYKPTVIGDFVPLKTTWLRE